MPETEALKHVCKVKKKYPEVESSDVAIQFFLAVFV